MGTRVHGNTSYEILTTFLHDERCDLGRWARRAKSKKRKKEKK